MNHVITVVLTIPVAKHVKRQTVRTNAKMVRIPIAAETIISMTMFAHTAVMTPNHGAKLVKKNMAQNPARQMYIITVNQMVRT